jgi:sialidase-1
MCSGSGLKTYKTIIAMMRRFLIVTFMVLCGQLAGQEQEQLEYLFESGSEGYECFRIPALVSTPQGTLLAFAEGRKKGCSDTGDIDLVLKRSLDNGQSWSELKVIWDDSVNVCGNPAPVVDELSGTIHLLSTWNLGTDHESDIIKGQSEDTRRVFHMSSSDEGLSWSEPLEITTSVKQENWTWYATGPCHGIQLRNGPQKGRLLIPCDHIEAGTFKYYSHSIYSDDHGQSWQLGGTTPQDQVNECAVAELSDGRLILNMRNYDRSQKSRKIAFSDDGGITWGDIKSDRALIEPICQASLLSLFAENRGMPILYFLNPAHKNKRQNLTLRTSRDEGARWKESIVLHEGPGAYSDLTHLHNGNLGCLFEAGSSSPYEGIVFLEVSL